MKAGIVEIGWTFIFQIINTIILIRFLWGIVYLIFKMPKKLKNMSERIAYLEKDLNQIKKQLKG